MFLTAYVVKSVLTNAPPPRTQEETARSSKGSSAWESSLTSPDKYGIQPARSRDDCLI